MRMCKDVPPTVENVNVNRSQSRQDIQSLLRR
jgi:hypothetical protein